MPETATRPITLPDAAALLGGLVSGAIGAYAYYSPSLRPLAHAFTLWIALLAAVVPGARDTRAIVRAVVALAAAVLVTVGLVLVVRALMHNDDRRTTLFAVLVGLLLTVSPAILVLLGR